MLSSIPPFFTAVLVINLMFFLTLHRDKNTKALIPLTFVTVWWHLSWVFLFSTKVETTAATIAKLGHIGILFIPVGILYFFRNLVAKIHLKIGIVVYFFLLTILVTSNLIINGVYLYDYGFYPKAGPLHFLLLLFIMYSQVIATIGSLKKRKEKITKIERQRIDASLIALAVFSCAALDFLSNYQLTDLYPIGFIFSTIFIAIIIFANLLYSFYDREDQILLLERQTLEAKRLESLGLLTAGIGHEIGNLMNGIAAGARALTKIGNKSAVDGKDLENIKSIARISSNGCAAISQVIQDIRSLVEEPMVSTFRVSEVLKESIEASQTPRAAIRLFGDLKLSSDKGAVMQALTNIIKNAEAALHGTEFPSIEIMALFDGNRWKIIVQDNGPGISTEIIDVIFEPFTTTKGSVGGTGLGLYVTQQKLLRSHINISAKNQITGGAVFTIEGGASQVEEFDDEEKVCVFSR